MHPQPHPYQPPPAWRPQRRWWQHPALIITLLVLLPPAGIALAWLGHWTTRTKAVASVLSGLWFLLVLVIPPEEKAPEGDPKPAVTASPAPAPTSESPSPEPTTESPSPEPTTATPTPEPTTEAPSPDPTTRAPEPEPEPTTQAPKTLKPKLPPQTTRPPETAEPDPEPYYANCAAVRAAGAAPIYAGDPGYSRKLDRDGDGVACEN
ncbi:excalibur calcium-binding domain-containing protein [Streptomyces termitum]|uniref:Excalibur calcium-binding domain-containing protein n=1 Tax=Streptomyces termitum TaxID=67368 RepID=A0A918SQT7_9ACTN|nr:excalibur calcium-binding domain-containing protein [Streptomyces termitum]GHA64482.1 hypothetical protein GCM10010305_02540 [Streptomyces termitum]